MINRVNLTRKIFSATMVAPCLWLAASVASGEAGDSKRKSKVNSEKTYKVNPYGKVFVGDGIVVEMAVFSEKNSDGLHDVLLKITGGPAHEAGLDGKVHKYTSENAGTGVNFQYLKDGEPRTRMVSRSAWGSWSFFEVYLNGKTYKVYYDEKKSQESKGLHLLSAFKDNN